MTDTTITLELPRNLFFTTDAQSILLPSHLDRIVERNLDQGLAGALFAIGTAAFAVLTAIGIAGY